MFSIAKFEPDFYIWKWQQRGAGAERAWIERPVERHQTDVERCYDPQQQQQQKIQFKRDKKTRFLVVNYHFFFQKKKS